MAKRSREASGPGSAAKDASAPVPQSSPAQSRAKDLQNRLVLTKEGPLNADTKDFCGSFAALDLDNSWDYGAFKKGFSIEITKLSDEVVEFDMSGIEPPLANAFRRILIAEVPTVAFSRVTIYQNTGVIHDENLAHRIGLVPIKFEPDNLQWKPTDAEFDEANSLRFTLHITCDEDRKAVYSGDLQWEPWSEDQAKRFRDNTPRPVADDILLAQLRSGQEIECECVAEKGLGKEHAKWSPVCTAFYRLLPDIELTQPIAGDDADALVQACPMGVFDIEEAANVRHARVANPRACTTCRECIESFPGREKGLVLGKAKNHYLFTIESVGAIPAPALFQRALQKLKEKCETAKKVLKKTSAERG